MAPLVPAIQHLHPPSGRPRGQLLHGIAEPAPPLAGTLLPGSPHVPALAGGPALTPALLLLQLQVPWMGSLICGRNVPSASKRPSWAPPGTKAIPSHDVTVTWVT